MITWVRLVALPPDGVNVTDEMLRSVVPQFHDTPTSISRLLPVPVVWEKLTLVALAAPVPLVGVPSGETAESEANWAVTVMFLVTLVSVRGLAVDPSSHFTKW